MRELWAYNLSSISKIFIQFCLGLTRKEILVYMADFTSLKQALIWKSMLSLNPMEILFLEQLSIYLVQLAL